MKKTLQAFSAAILLLAILMLVNGISNSLFRKFYWDLTEEKLYSLSDGTKNIIANLKEPIRLKLYFSKTDASSAPGFKLYGKRIEDFLKQYQSTAAGKIDLEIYDPRPDSEEEDWANNYGLKAAALPSGDSIFLGLYGVNGQGKEEAIPFFDINRQEFLEYDITSLIYSLSKEKQNVIGILSSIDVLGETQTPEGNSSPWTAIDQLKQIAEVKKIDASASEIPSDLSLLIVIHPKNLSQDTLFAIDQYVMKGNNLLAMVDPYLEIDSSGADPNNPMSAYTQDKSSDLNILLEKWGAKLIKDQAVADIDNATLVNAGKDGVQKYLVWLSLGKDFVDQDDIATSRLENLVFPWAGALEDTKAKGISFTKLAFSGSRASLIGKQQYMFGGGDPLELLKSSTTGMEQYSIAVKLSGKFKTNFPEGLTDKSQNQNSNSSSARPILLESVKQSTIIVISDADFMTDRFSVNVQNFFGAKLVRKINDNLNLFLNLAENLQGSNDLISLRSRGNFSRPFTKIQQMQTDAQQRWKVEENRLQAELNTTNERLAQLQNQNPDKQEGEQVLTPEMLEEIKKFREQRKDVQNKLREVRKNLRQDIEKLENNLFFFNTFLIPLLIIFGTLLLKSINSRNSK